MSPCSGSDKRVSIQQEHAEIVWVRFSVWKFPKPVNPLCPFAEHLDSSWSLAMSNIDLLTNILVKFIDIFALPFVVKFLLQFFKTIFKFLIAALEFPAKFFEVFIMNKRWNSIFFSWRLKMFWSSGVFEKFPGDMYCVENLEGFSTFIFAILFSAKANKDVH